MTEGSKKNIFILNVQNNWRIDVIFFAVWLLIACGIDAVNAYLNESDKEWIARK